MLKLLSRHFRKPEGLFGLFIANRMEKRNYHAYHALDRHAQIENGMSIFEIGFGPGYGIKHFLENYDISYNGLDYSPIMFKNAKKLISKRYSENSGKLYYGDFLEYKHKDDLVDLILFSNVTYFWKELSLPFSKIFSMLNNKGRLVFYMTDKKLLEINSFTNNKHFNHHDKNEVVKTLLNCGFSNVKQTPVSDNNEHRIIIEAEKI